MNTPENNALTLAMIGKDDAEYLIALTVLSCRLERERDEARLVADGWRENWRKGSSMSMVSGSKLPWEGTKS